MTTKRILATSGVPFEVRRVSWAGEWSGCVLTGGGADVSDPARRHLLPDLAEWMELLPRFVDDPAALPGYALLKYSREGEVFRGRLPWAAGVLEVACKRIRVRGLVRSFPAVWRLTREQSHFNRAVALLRADIGTALPLAVIKRKAGGRETWLVTEYLAETVDLDQVVLTLLPRLRPTRYRLVKNAIGNAIAKLFHRLAAHGFHHRDLKASNILLTNWDTPDRVRLWLVDLDGLRLRSVRCARLRWQPLIRLAASLSSYATVTRTDYCRCLCAYLARTGIPRQEWKQHFVNLADQATGYVRRARQRKTHKLDGYAGGG